MRPFKSYGRSRYQNTPYKRRKSGGSNPYRYRAAPPMAVGYVNPTRQELKAFDTIIMAQSSGGGVSDTVIGSLVPSLLGTQPAMVINGIPIGNDITQRIGRKVMMSSIYLRFHLQYWGGRGNTGGPVLPDPVPLPADGVPGVGNLSPSAYNPHIVRCMLVYDKQPNGVLPVNSDILESTGANLGSFVNPTCPNKLSYRDRFVTLWDRVYHLDRNGTNAIPVKVYKKLGLGVTFNSDAGAPAANDIVGISTGALYFVYFGDLSNPIRTPPTISQYTPTAPLTPTEATVVTCGIINNLFARVRYTDS